MIFPLFETLTKPHLIWSSAIYPPSMGVDYGSGISFLLIGDTISYQPKGKDVRLVCVRRGSHQTRRDCLQGTQDFWCNISQMSSGNTGII